jgi:hypothetical protein
VKFSIDRDRVRLGISGIGGVVHRYKRGRAGISAICEVLHRYTSYYLNLRRYRKVALDISGIGGFEKGLGIPGTGGVVHWCIQGRAGDLRY